MKRVYLFSLMVCFAFATPAMAATYRLHVLGMYCPFCAYSLHHKLMALSGVRSASVDLKHGLIVIQTAPGQRLAEPAIKNWLPTPVRHSNRFDSSPVTTGRTRGLHSNGCRSPCSAHMVLAIGEQALSKGEHL